ncbi:hypothetical protein SAMN05216257_101332 [Meinhardsimonia xiamenensis]|jgi:hypothetical protein|uniref:Uncharacterized protein n=1 Tax=Meinhardsimonia xiamenensis TaxID=990712 RepID=A0A1G8YIC3_9RHOB|nr:argininosuccinate lyase [Meinhardsimonia xiamenensis]SDK02397.1 hypothetical protein SAMN05216257_101332 [Meinhardsimonia xiamenensis]
MKLVLALTLLLPLITCGVEGPPVPPPPRPDTTQAG